jgi:M6 family metalloprotease-like protein
MRFRALTPVLLTVFCQLLVLFPRTASALEPPRPGEIGYLKATGQYADRLAYAQALGNDRIDQGLLEQALYRAWREAVIQQGGNPDLMEPAPPPARKLMPTTGNVKVFALLVDFQDWPSFSTPSEIDSALFGDGGAIPGNQFPYESLTSYYERSSYNLLHLSGMTIGWYHAPYNRSAVVESAAGREAVIKEAIAAFDGSVDFSQFDNDGDGTIEYFIVVWTGPDTGWATFWWGYRTSWTDSGYSVDGKSLAKYSWQWEGDGPNHFGPYNPHVVIHETGHGLGLPDFYDYDDTVGPDGGVGGLDMMDANWGDHNSFSKWVLEWLTPTVVATGSQTLTLNPSGTSPEAVVVMPGAVSSDAFREFFVAQNRCRVADDPAPVAGGPTAYPTDGMLVWHVDARLNGAGTDYAYDNSYTDHKLVKLMQADGLDRIENQSAWADAAMYYLPGRWLGPLTTPSSQDYGGNDTGVYIAGITGGCPQMTAAFGIASQQADIRVNGSLDFKVTCVGSFKDRVVSIFNVGTADLSVDRVIVTAGGADFQLLPNPVQPFVVHPGSHVDVTVRFTPTSAEGKTGTLEIVSNDWDQVVLDLPMSGTGGVGRIATSLADDGNFGNVCVGSFKDLTLTITNTGTCPLSVSSVTSTSGEVFVPIIVSYPLVIGAGDSLGLPIRLQPGSFGPKGATLQVHSDDPDHPVVSRVVTGNAPPPQIRVTGSTDFGDVCAGVLAEKTISVANVGPCDLHVSSVAFEPATGSFTLVNNPFPATVSPDSQLDVVIRFTPTSVGPKGATLVIRSDDPLHPAVSLVVTANTPAPMIDVPPDQAFPPTVIQSVGPCQSLRPFPISNTGKCNLTITNIVLGGPDGIDYHLVGLPAFPVVLQPGHIAGEGALKIAFAPMLLDRDLVGSITVTYVSDPITGATTSVTRTLCGEGVRTGARVLVEAAGIPLQTVESIKLQRLAGNRNKSIVDTVDISRDLPLITVVPAPPCGPFQYHREYGTVSNPIQLLPGSYTITVTALINRRKVSRTVAFSADTCTFNQTIVVNF